MRKKKSLVTAKKVLKLKAQSAQKPPEPAEPLVTVTEIPETGELEIKRIASEYGPAKSIRFPKDSTDIYQLPPEEFASVQNAIEDLGMDNRRVAVHADSLESFLGYDSLIRVMNKAYSRYVAFYRSEAGGSLSPEEARKAAYRRRINNDEAIELFNDLMRYSTESIGFRELMELHDNSPAMAQNLWEMIKRAAGQEFETGHRAAAAFEPADYMTDAWNRASYLGLRESLCEEYKPKGGIELTMIDGVAQAWLMLQHWTEESVRRARTEPRRENHRFVEWKQWNKQADPKQWSDGHWDVPTVSEKEAVEHAAQMADRWQRMYFRAIRSLQELATIRAAGDDQ